MTTPPSTTEQAVELTDGMTPEMYECEHDYTSAKHVSRATWVCPKCGADVSLVYVMMREAEGPPPNV